VLWDLAGAISKHLDIEHQIESEHSEQEPGASRDKRGHEREHRLVVAANTQTQARPRCCALKGSTAGASVALLVWCSSRSGSITPVPARSRSAMISDRTPRWNGHDTRDRGTGGYRKQVRSGSRGSVIGSGVKQPRSDRLTTADADLLLLSHGQPTLRSTPAFVLACAPRHDVVSVSSNVSPVAAVAAASWMGHPAARQCEHLVPPARVRSLRNLSSADCRLLQASRSARASNQT
jgi:hypothetical protein